MRLHADQVMLEQVQWENQCLNQQITSLTAAFMAVRKMDARDPLAKKKAQKEAQEEPVFLESEIELPRNVPGEENRTETTAFQLSSDVLVTSSITPCSTVDVSTYSSDMSFVDWSHSASVTGTIESSSSAQSHGLAHTLQSRTIAQLRDGTEIPDWEPAPPRNLSLPLTVSRQHQNYFSPLLIDSGKIAQSLRCIKTYGRTCSAYEDYYQNSASSAIGNVKISEVDPDGHFIKILNSSPEKEENIGNYVLKQDIQGQPVAEFCFPPETRMEANSTVTVWAADAKVLHRPPSDFLWNGLETSGTSLNCTTILCDPNGQAVSWYSPLYWNGKQGWLAKEESEDFENIVVPTFSTAKQKEEWEEKQAFTLTDRKWKKADSEQTRKKGQSFIKREKKTFACLFPNQSAWCQSPDSPTHPHFSLVRPLTLGNDGSSLCRQSRCQSSRPDPVPGTLYAGSSWRKDPSVPSCERGECRTRPTWSAGPNFGGVMYVESLPLAGTALQKYFVTPSYSYMLRTRHLL
ncbi:lamin tail domain-containing protein 1 isoform X1 [Anas acuta]|uniref:lamin tail domain-containing protein 1 isoform X1 n=2 Tax=Anas acuta TaxID=28680 RepID=UPI0035C8AABA